MAPEDGVSAIVLAGGRSSRFGRDKLAEPIDGRPLLHHAIDGVRPIAAEVVVVVAPDATPGIPGDVVLIHDPTPFEGPLAGLAAGLRGARHAVCLVVGADSPSLVSGVLGLLVAALDDPSMDAAILDDAGRPRPLPAAVRRDPGLVAAERLLVDGQRRLRLLFEALSTHPVPEELWRRLDPDGATLRDIDTPADLPGLTPTDARTRLDG
jgi:molybdopterin-guanine dinucleotide biosynthesis protein A